MRSGKIRRVGIAYLDEVTRLESAPYEDCREGDSIAVVENCGQIKRPRTEKIVAYMKPVMKQKAASGNVACDGSTSDVRCVQNVGLVFGESGRSASPLLPRFVLSWCDTGAGNEPDSENSTFSMIVIVAADVQMRGIRYA